MSFFTGLSYFKEEFEQFLEVYNSLESQAQDKLPLTIKLFEKFMDETPYDDYYYGQDFLSSIPDFFRTYPNSLLIQAIGNDGQSIDEDTGLFLALTDDLIREHVVFVENYSKYKRKSPSSFA